jgi:thiosulfate/3-mercaptopyruvate sulfurtransferase
MINRHLMQADELHELIQSGDCVVADCSFDLSDPGKGREDWLKAHIPSAAYVNLDHDLASEVTEDSGRHPLPDKNDFAGLLARIGWTPGKTLVAYDQGSNAIAVRMWWLMRYFGQPAALLDGGFSEWKARGLPLESGETAVNSQQPTDLVENLSMTADCIEILARLKDPGMTIVDARAPERFSGKIEPLDSKGGHIPGAINRPLNLNIGSDGRFKSVGDLRSEFESLLGKKEPEAVVHSCGSGVTACHNYFAMTLAGMNPGRVYPGSWSEWIRDPKRPIETADQGSSV